MLADIEIALDKCNDADGPKILETRRALRKIKMAFTSVITVGEATEAMQREEKQPL